MTSAVVGGGNELLLMRPALFDISLSMHLCILPVGISQIRTAVVWLIGHSSRRPHYMSQIMNGLSCNLEINRLCGQGYDDLQDDLKCII